MWTYHRCHGRQDDLGGKACCLLSMQLGRLKFHRIVVC